MNAIELHRYIQAPATLSVDSLNELKRLMEVYPYFQTLKLLYLKNLWLLQHPDFELELRRLAIEIADRKALYILLKGEPAVLDVAEVKAGESSSASFDLIDAFLASGPQGNPAAGSKTEIVPESSAAVDYLHWTQSRKDEPVSSVAPTSPSEDTAKLKHQDLIDSFIAHESDRRVNLQEPDPVADEESNDEVSIKPLDDTYFTETLARIYIKQKRYDKALQIIKNLNLKYPEKNIYFADQIRFLEKLIINTKK